MEPCRCCDCNRRGPFDIVLEGTRRALDFAARCDAAARAEADKETARLRDRYEDRVKRAQVALTRAEQRTEELQTEVDTRKRDELIGGAGDLIGALFGGRRSTRGIVGTLTRGSSRRSMTARTAERLESSREVRTDGSTASDTYL